LPHLENAARSGLMWRGRCRARAKTTWCSSAPRSPTR
jgi:hypothetical protein